MMSDKRPYRMKDIVLTHPEYDDEIIKTYVPTPDTLLGARHDVIHTDIGEPRRVDRCRGKCNCDDQIKTENDLMEMYEKYEKSELGRRTLENELSKNNQRLKNSRAKCKSLKAKLAEAEIKNEKTD